jgi:hypothetical protein
MNGVTAGRTVGVGEPAGGAVGSGCVGVIVAVGVMVGVNVTVGVGLAVGVGVSGGGAGCSDSAVKASISTLVPLEAVVRCGRILTVRRWGPDGNSPKV